MMMVTCLQNIMTYKTFENNITILNCKMNKGHLDLYIETRYKRKDFNCRQYVYICNAKKDFRIIK